MTRRSLRFVEPDEGRAQRNHEARQKARESAPPGGYVRDDTADDVRDFLLLFGKNTVRKHQDRRALALRKFL